MCSQHLCNIAYTAALLTHSLYGLPVLVMQTLVLSFRHVLCSFPSSFAFMVKKISVSEFLRSARSSFLLFPIKKENRQRLYNLLSIFILKLILRGHFVGVLNIFVSFDPKSAYPCTVTFLPFWQDKFLDFFRKNSILNIYLQIWFIGRTLASQAGKAGSIPVICFF